eukprot:451755-Amphidinium_carterae.1
MSEGPDLAAGPSLNDCHSWHPHDKAAVDGPSKGKRGKLAPAPVHAGPCKRFTTVIVRNLPMHVDQSRLHSALQDVGLDGTFDYLYVPVNFDTGCPRRYGFINFITHQLAVQFCEFISVTLPSTLFPEISGHQKALRVEVASAQGIQALIAQSSIKKVRNPNLHPLIFRGASHVALTF